MMVLEGIRDGVGTKNVDVGNEGLPGWEALNRRLGRDFSQVKQPRDAYAERIWEARRDVASASRQPHPFALSLSKGCPFLSAQREKQGQGFDKLSPNGF
jgi:hypothetical protein